MSKTFPEDVLEKAEPGAILEMEFDGIFMESYPCQVNSPYRLTYAGMVEDSEMHRLSEEADALRKFVRNETDEE